MPAEALRLATIVALAERAVGGHGLADDGLLRRVSAMLRWIDEHLSADDSARFGLD